jgi:protein-S-isoprenylcysteine O-methyltransferase Ste14
LGSKQGLGRGEHFSKGALMTTRNFVQKLRSVAAQGGIIVFFIMAFEVMIMISPFAFFFYSVFNSFLHWLENFSATRWLTDFFLPHMILPPTLFLKSIRILGSVLFVVGAVTFAICALQVYLGKIFKWGIADKGLYSIIRHPQYLALGLWGTGMSILWPRFLVLVSLALMFILYYFLAKDEERRMLAQFGEGYHQYMDRTGMFLPRGMERWISLPVASGRHRLLRYAGIVVGVPALVIGTGFVLRAITLDSLLFKTNHNLTLVALLPEDDPLSEKALDAMVKSASPSQKELAFLEEGKDYLGYLMPVDYVMQGMIANTGQEFHLHEQQHTFALIADWVLNPFEHLRRSPSAIMAEMHNVDPGIARRHHCPLGLNDPALQCAVCPYRRVILIEIDHAGRGHLADAGLFSFGTQRVPVCYVDVNTATGEIVSIHKVGRATAWKDVPTPAI